MVTKEINTVLVDANYKKFRAAMKRSVMGVTYATHKRKKGDFYQHKIHNETITDLTIDKIWSEIIAHIDNNLDMYKLKGNYKIEWDKQGKILSFSDIIIRIVIDYGIMAIDKITIESRTEPINIILFTSDYDFKSRDIRNRINVIINNYDEQEIIFTEYNLSTTEGKEKAKLFHVVGSPTLCYDDEKLENPSENDIMNLLSKIKLSKIISEGSTFSQSQPITITVNAISE